MFLLLVVLSVATVTSATLQLESKQNMAAVERLDRCIPGKCKWQEIIPGSLRWCDCCAYCTDNTPACIEDEFFCQHPNRCSALQVCQLQQVQDLLNAQTTTTTTTTVSASCAEPDETCLSWNGFCASRLTGCPSGSEIVPQVACNAANGGFECFCCHSLVQVQSGGPPPPTPWPTRYPTPYPTVYPTKYPTRHPTAYPTEYPTAYPTHAPTGRPTHAPETSPPTPRPTEVTSTLPPTPQECPAVPCTDEGGFCAAECPPGTEIVNPTIGSCTQYGVCFCCEPTEGGEPPSPAPTDAVGACCCPYMEDCVELTQARCAESNCPVQTVWYGPGTLCSQIECIDGTTEVPTNAPTEKPTEVPTELPTPRPTTPELCPTYVCNEATNAFCHYCNECPPGYYLVPADEGKECNGQQQYCMCCAKITDAPTTSPTVSPTKSPTPSPSASPTKSPTPSPSQSPTKSPSPAPSKSPTKSPSPAPSTSPTQSPTKLPTTSPSQAPSKSPSPSPTPEPTASPVRTCPQPLNKCKDMNGTCVFNYEDCPEGTEWDFQCLCAPRSECVCCFPKTPEPTVAPTKSPTKQPTKNPTKSPSPAPSNAPTKSPSPAPSKSPSPGPTASPTWSPVPSCPNPLNKCKDMNGTCAFSARYCPEGSEWDGQCYCAPYSQCVCCFPKTPEPSPSSSLAPSPSPSNAPTKSPTLNPTVSPTLSPVPQCPSEPEGDCLEKNGTCAWNARYCPEGTVADLQCKCTAIEDDTCVCCVPLPRTASPTQAPSGTQAPGTEAPGTQTTTTTSTATTTTTTETEPPTPVAEPGTGLFDQPTPQPTDGEEEDVQEDNDDEEEQSDSDSDSDNDDCIHDDNWFWEFRLFDEDCGTITALGVLIIIILPILVCICLLFFACMVYNDGATLQPPVEADESAPLVANIMRQDGEESFFDAYEKKIH